MLHPLANSRLLQTQNAAVVIPTLLRPTLERAVKSVFDQEFDGTLQVLIGIDAAEGDRAVLDRLSNICPAHIRIDVLEPGYSTAFRRGGLYPARAGGALRTILSYLANSTYVAYLDDDNWWGPTHLSSLLAVIEDADWAFSDRWFVEPATQEPICIDRWESVGVGLGVYGATLGGFVDTSSLLLNKLSCHDILPQWSRAAFADGSGEDRLVFDGLKTRKGHQTGQATSFYLAKADDAMASNRLQLFRENGIVLPSQQRAAVITLAKAIAPLADKRAQPATNKNSINPGSAETDVLLNALVERLKPQEVLSFAADRSTLAINLADICFAAGLTPTIAVFDPPADLRARRSGIERLVLLSGYGISYLADVALAVDLIHTAKLPPTDLETLLNQAWRLLRGGGIVLGEGEVGNDDPLTVFLTKFAADHGAELLPASVDVRHRWILQKG